MKKVWFFLLFSACVTNISAQEAEAFHIKGELKNMPGTHWIFLSYFIGENNVTDSAEVKDNGYHFNGTVKGTEIPARFWISHEIAVPEFGHIETVDFFLSPGNLTVTHDRILANASFTGNLINAELTKLQRAARPYEKSADSLRTVYKTAKIKEDKPEMISVTKKLYALSTEKNEKVYGDYMTRYPNSPLAFYALQKCNPQSVEDYRHMLVWFKKLPKTIRTSTLGVGYRDALVAGQKVAIGAKAPDFMQNDTAGNPVRSSAFRGNYVLVDFWASWCHPCRGQNPNLIKAWQKYHAKGFDILGVALENSKEDWLKAIHTDHLLWQQVSDLKYGDNAVAILFHVGPIPMNFLIDPNGKIIAKDLRDEEIENTLSEIYKN